MENKDFAAFLDSRTQQNVTNIDSFLACYLDGDRLDNLYRRQEKLLRLRARAKQLEVPMTKFDALAAAARYDFQERLKQVAKKQSGDALTIDRVAEALEETGIQIGYDMLLRRVSVTGMPPCYSAENAVNTLPVYLGDYLRKQGVKGVTRGALDDCLACVADFNRFNPLEVWLRTVLWDKTDRIAEIYSILGVTNPRHKVYIRKWLIQCVAMALNDEIHPVGADGVLVLQGPQGIAKTSFFRRLVIDPRWFAEGVSIDMRDKDSVMRALSGWITELGELDSTLRREQSSLKAFITQPRDHLRAPYARESVDFVRRTSFCGTVNEQEYLRDETGTRRFWTVPVSHIDKARLFALNLDWQCQLWAQVHALYLENPQGFRLTEEELQTVQRANRANAQPMAFEPEIRNIMQHLPAAQWEWWTAADVAAQKLAARPSAYQTGRVLRRILPELVAQLHENEQQTLTAAEKLGTENGNFSAENEAEKYIRKARGIFMFLLPLEHYPKKKKSAGSSGQISA